MKSSHEFQSWRWEVKCISAPWEVALVLAPHSCGGVGCASPPPCLTSWFERLWFKSCPRRGPFLGDTFSQVLSKQEGKYRC